MKKQKNEPEKYYKLLQQYLHLGHSRTKTQIANQTNYTRKHIQHIAKKYNWNKRAEKFDIKNREQLINTAQQQFQETRTKQLNTLTKLYQTIQTNMDTYLTNHIEIDQTQPPEKIQKQVKDLLLLTQRYEKITQSLEKSIQNYGVQDLPTTRKPQKKDTKCNQCKTQNKKNQKKQEPEPKKRDPLQEFWDSPAMNATNPNYDHSKVKPKHQMFDFDGREEAMKFQADLIEAFKDAKNPEDEEEIYRSIGFQYATQNIKNAIKHAAEHPVNFYPYQHNPECNPANFPEQEYDFSEFDDDDDNNNE